MNDHCKFFLGTHKAHWLRLTPAPLFISRRRLSTVKNPPKAIGEWALDSGGFSELSLFGKWTISPAQYIGEARQWMETPGRLQWAAAMDHMCEPFITGKTGLTVKEHQQRTVDNFCQLKATAPEIPWLPVLQGFRFEDYLHCIELYKRAGIKLASLPLVGLGSICRRQGTRFATDLCRHLHREGIKLHGFGLKITGLATCAPFLKSCDSMAWSFDARRAAPLPGCLHATCANCIRYALQWRKRIEKEILAADKRPLQSMLF